MYKICITENGELAFSSLYLKEKEGMKKRQPRVFPATSVIKYLFGILGTPTRCKDPYLNANLMTTIISPAKPIYKFLVAVSYHKLKL